MMAFKNQDCGRKTSSNLKRAPSFAILLILFFLWIPQAQAASVIANLGSSGTVLLPIGSDLEAIWPASPKNANIDVVLVDETDQEVVRRTISTGPTGWQTPAGLWTATGVMGCDDLALLSESNFYYQDFEAALDDLIGRVFEIRVVGTDTVTTVQMVTPVDPIYYFSDKLGCPRGSFELGEVMHISGWATGSVFLPTEVFLFLISDDGTCQPLFDVRTDPQQIYLSPLTQKFTEEVGVRCELDCGGVRGVVRPSLEASCSVSASECGPLSCDNDPSDIRVLAIDALQQAIRFIKGDGIAEPGWDDGQCDSCGSGS